MAEYQTSQQVNYGWGLSLNMTGKAPAIAKRIFETLADAQAYADDVNDSAIAGLQLSVINDSDPEKNGIYFVKSIGDGVSSAILELIGKSVISSGEGSVDLADYAKLTDLEGVKTWVEEQNYLTEHQDISHLATKSEIPTLDEYAKTEDVQGMVDSAVDEHLNSYGVTTKVTYLSESEWTALKDQVDSGETSWEEDVIYMIYSND